jgi:hypothetical protein
MSASRAGDRRDELHRASQQNGKETLAAAQAGRLMHVNARQGQAGSNAAYCEGMSRSCRRLFNEVD